VALVFATVKTRSVDLEDVHLAVCDIGGAADPRPT